MSKLFNAVAEYETALAADEIAGDAWKAARDAAERELVRVHPEYEGGSFAFNDDNGADDQLYWVAPECDWPGVAIADAPVVVRAAARMYGVSEALTTERRATARWIIATDRMLRTPCADVRDTLEKFRALGLDDGYLVTSRVYAAALASIETVVAEASAATLSRAEKRGDPAAPEPATV